MGLPGDDLSLTMRVLYRLSYVGLEPRILAAVALMVSGRYVIGARAPPVIKTYPPLSSANRTCSISGLSSTFRLEGAASLQEVCSVSPQSSPASAAARAQRFDPPGPLEFAQDLVDVAIADPGCRLADVGDRELPDHQRVDERRDQRLLRPAATDRACATLELLVGGGENAKEVVRPRAQVMATVVPADRGQPPGRPGALLRPAPLRTGRAGFLASGSSKP
jgi:hypothetical protein